MNKENDLPLVSVIIPTYKRPAMLGRAIDSVLSQTYQNIEIIIVDDNDENSECRKDTERFMKKYKENDNIIYIKNRNNKGGGLARNTGIKNANGEYISFLDDDDEYLKKKIEMQINKIKTTLLDQLGFVYCGLIYYDKRGNIFKEKNEQIRGGIDVLKKHFMRSLTSTPALLVKRDALEKINGFDNVSKGQDFRLIAKLLYSGYNCDFVEQNLVNVYWHDNYRITTSRKAISGIKQNYLFKIKICKKLKDSNLEKKVRWKYQIDCANYYCAINKILSIHYVIKSLKYQLFSIQICKMIFKLIFGKRFSQIIKRIIWKLRQYNFLNYTVRG